ncbi:uncharacterized protein LOC141692766 [Apium graveolens]|uniref:uncharacterized protein LOC141692766 n=1 Tax=Apium graveolens TaxID=4045 RepID=UPI003D7BE1CA
MRLKCTLERMLLQRSCPFSIMGLEEYVFFLQMELFLVSPFSKGRFEILSLTGSFTVSENGGYKRTGRLSVSLAGPNGRVIGGGIAGTLITENPIQGRIRCECGCRSSNMALVLVEPLTLERVDVDIIPTVYLDIIQGTKSINTLLNRQGGLWSRYGQAEQPSRSLQHQLLHTFLLEVQAP